MQIDPERILTNFTFMHRVVVERTFHLAREYDMQRAMKIEIDRQIREIKDTMAAAKQKENEQIIRAAISKYKREAPISKFVCFPSFHTIFL